ncbi:ferredoxin [Pseudosporangium ferrugineum]|uniref:ferredoxin n=1 Tax=Pseudosporangium ferrugineum TaxID=439699 RepID=UPI000D05E686|nr:ferredoxin [Pseudosporangium ferrugineum]
MRIVVDEERCTASGQCVVVAPDVFDQRESDGIVVLLAVSPSPQQENGVLRAAEVCPTVAITVLE